MKRNLFSTFLICFCALAFAQQAPKPAAAPAAPAAPAAKLAPILLLKDVISFDKMQHDFGKIKQGVPVTTDFTFVNKSNKPIIIEDVRASCGCTKPKKPEQPVLPAQSDKINVGFNAATLGSFHKTIFVKAVDFNDLIEIVIKGEVIPDGGL